MTTIACNQEMMAADSMGSVEYGGYVYTTRKLYRVAEDLMGLSGAASAGFRFMKWYEDGQDPDSLPEFDPESEFFVALVLRSDGIWRYEGGCFPIPVLDEYSASGDGAAIALAAMRLGKSPEEAVELACELNGPTGPPVVVEKL